MKKVLISLFIVINCVLGVYSQYNFSYFEHINSKNGLSSNSVNAIYKDSYGFMWFGTYNGLNMYDGYEIKSFYHDTNDSLSISGNRITDIFEDSKGNIWVATYVSGLNRFNRFTETFTRFKADENDASSISSNFVSSLAEDKNGNLWVGTLNNGINLFNYNTNSFIQFKHDSLNVNSLGSIEVNSIAVDKHNVLWIANNHGDLASYNIDKNTFSNFVYDASLKGEMHSETFGKMMVDTDNNIWIGTEKGAYLFNTTTNTCKRISTDSEKKTLNVDAATTILELKQDLILIATDHGGLNVYDKSTNTITYTLSNQYDYTSLSNNQVLTAYKDNDNNVWIGNYRGGVNVYLPLKTQFKFYYPKPNQNSLNYWSVISMHADSKGKIWIGTDGGGINIFNPDTEHFDFLVHNKNDKNSISSNVITAVHEDKNGNYWIGTYLGGLNIYNPQTGRNAIYTAANNDPNAISNYSVWCFAEDKDENIWIGTGNGLDCYIRKEKTFHHYKNDKSDPNSLSGNWVEELLFDSDGNLWVGTNTNGISKLNAGSNKFVVYKHNEFDSTSINNNHINKIFEDQFKNIWISTAVGLSKYNKEEDNFTDYSKNSLLKNYVVVDIISDKDSSLWLATNKGLIKFNTSLREGKVYNKDNGLFSDELSGNSALLDQNGKAYFATTKGFFTFNPDSIITNQNVPEIVITDFFISDKRIAVTQKNSVLKKNINHVDTLYLSYKQSNFAFNFSALDYTSPSNNNYAYKLEGFDKKWHYVGNERKAKYTNIPHGHFVFMVKGSNNNNIWNPEAKKIHIFIKPPFWRTIAFKMLIAFVFVFLMFFIYKLRVNSIIKQKIILEKEVAKRTLELSETNVLLEEKHEEVLIQKEQIEHHGKNLEMMVEKRTHELKLEKEKAEEADRLKTAFLANMSHEIRTPMNAIVGFSGLLGIPDLEQDKKEQYIEYIESNSNSLLNLINDILDFSRIESNQLEITSEQFNLVELLEELNEYWSIKCGEKRLGFNLKIELDKAEIIIDSDKKRINQIVSNLLSNALKFTNKGYLELGVNLTMNDVVIYVKDTGIGIDAKHHQVIFERFRKVAKGEDELFGGVGLGLSITKKLTDLIGGTIMLDSTPGKGSVFYLKLPFTSGA